MLSGASFLIETCERQEHSLGELVPGMDGLSVVLRGSDDAMF